MLRGSWRPTHQEKHDLVLLVDVIAARQEEEKLVLELVDGSRAAEAGQFAQRVAAHGRAEPLVDADDEIVPRRNAMVLFQAIIPLAGSAVYVERRGRNLEIFRVSYALKNCSPLCSHVSESTVLSYLGNRSL